MRDKTVRRDFLKTGVGIAAFSIARPEWVWDTFMTTVLDLRLPVGQGTLIGVWEHQHKRADYVDSWWQVANWQEAAHRFDTPRQAAA